MVREYVYNSVVGYVVANNKTSLFTLEIFMLL
jgi:hypothetical protein